MNLLAAIALAISLLVPSSGAPGIDVSSANGSIDAFLGSQPQAAVFIRGTYGSFVDGSFAAHADQAARHGTPYYAYLFLRPDTVDASADAQVDAFLKVAHNARGFAIDWESDTFISRDGTLKSNGRASVAELAEAVARFHTLGLRVGVYASELAPYPQVGQDWTWVANYTRAPRIHADVWQYGGTALDRDVILAPLTTLDAIPPAPTGITFVSASGYDVASLPSVKVLAGTKVEDLSGHVWATLKKPTSLKTIGLVDGHGGQYVVEITTSRYFSDGKARPVWQRISAGQFIH